MKHIMVVFLALLIPLAANAGEYYVSPTGAAAWADCEHNSAPSGPKNGLSACSMDTAEDNAAAGDTVYFRGGTYVIESMPNERWQAGLMPVNSGTVTNPITFMAYQNEVPYIDNSVNNYQSYPVASFGTHFQNYIIFDGFETTVVPDNGGTGLCRGGLLHQSVGSVIRNSVIHGDPAGAGNCACVYLEITSNSRVYNNVLHGNTGSDPNGSGIMMYGNDGTHIYNNEIYDCSSGIYDKGGAENSQYYYNFFHDIPGQAIRIGTEAGANPHDNHAFQNVFLNISGQGMEQSPSKRPVSNITSSNNTFVRVNYIDINFSNANFSKTNFVAYNNLSYGANNTYYFDSGIVSFSDFNQFPSSAAFRWNNEYSGTINLSQWRSTTGFDVNSNTNDPGFVNPNGDKPADFKRTSYPLDGRGGIYPSVIGAYITGNECIGLLDECEQTGEPHESVIYGSFDIGSQN